MQTLNVSIDEKDFQKFGFESKEISFDNLLRSIFRQVALDALDKCNESAEKSGLSKMNMEEINALIKDVRDAKGNS